VSGGPVRTVSMGGVAVGIIVILSGIFLFAWSQGWLPFTLTLSSFCALGLVVLRVLNLCRVLRGRRVGGGGGGNSERPHLGEQRLPQPLLERPVVEPELPRRLRVAPEVRRARADAQDL